MNNIEDAKKIVLETFKNRHVERAGVSGDKVYVCAPYNGRSAKNDMDCIFVVSGGEAHVINYAKELGTAIKALSKGK